MTHHPGDVRSFELAFLPKQLRDAGYTDAATSLEAERERRRAPVSRAAAGAGASRRLEADSPTPARRTARNMNASGSEGPSNELVGRHR